MIFMRHVFMRPEGDDGKGSGGTGEGDKGGTGEGDKGGTGEGDKGGGSKEETVSRAEFDKVMKDMHRYKTAAAKVSDEKKAADDARMKEQNQWKELADARENEVKTAKEENTRLQSAVAYDKRFGAVKEKCQALGIRPEAISDLEGLDLESITLETTSTGRLNVLGADKFAERLKTLKPHWFTDPSKPKVNTSQTRVNDGGGGGAITPADLVTAEREGRKKGDLKAYHEMYSKFRQQRAGGKSA